MPDGGCEAHLNHCCVLWSLVCGLWWQAGAVLHSGLVAWGFNLIGMKGRVLLAHQIPLALVVTTLWLTEGRMDFGSKWCSYCLVYSFVYAAEPLWLPDGSPAAEVAKVPPGACFSGQLQPMERKAKAG